MQTINSLISKKRVLNAFLVLILALSFTMVTAAPAGAATTINVPGDYATIQAAVNAAGDGDTITVAAGTYAEQIQVTKKLTINGSNAGISAGVNAGTRGVESIVNGGFLIRTAADGTVIDGFTVQGGYVFGSHNNGFAVEPSGTPGITIQNNIIQNVTSPAQSSGIETVGGTNNLMVKNNKISGNWRGVYLNPAGGNQILGNIIDSNNGSGVGIGSDGQSNLTVSGNTISNQAEGWGSSAVGANIVAHNNNFIGNTVSVAWYSGSTIDATKNWWGDTDPSDDVSGNVDYSPWLGAAAGTSPVTWYTNDSIQDALLAASAGDTINVAAGTYDEMLVINKAGLTLKGANSGIHPVVGTHPTETPGARGAETILSHNGMYAISPQADGITIDGFKFTGGNGRLIDTYEDADNFHLTNCIFDSPTQAVSKGVIQFGGGSHTDMLIDFNLFQDQGDHTIYTGGGPFDRLHIAYNKFNGYGDGVFWTATQLVDGVIEYNEFDGTIGGIPGQGGTGLNIGQGGNIAIRNNWFHDMYYTGFQVGIIGGSVLDNTFENTYPIQSGGIWYPSDSFQLWGGEWGTAISTDVTIMGNTISFNQQSNLDASENGIRLRTGCDAANIHVNSNDFVNGGVSPTAFAVRNQGTGTLDAENNWWGTASEPDIQSLLDGDVDYDPWTGDPGSTDYEYIGDGNEGTLNVDGSSVDVNMNDGQSGGFSATAQTGAPAQGFAGMGDGKGLNKSIVVETTAANGTYIAVIKLSYTDAELLAAGIDEDDLRLYYYDTAASLWKLAVEGNVGPTNNIRWMGDSAPVAAIAANLGMHGVDKTSNIAWAVVDHNTDYSAGIGPVEAWVDDDWNNQADVDTYNPALTWHVDAFNKIQDAIDSCAAGATINILAGIYTENLVVDKAGMTLFGYNAGNSIIEPGAGVGIDVRPGGAGLTLDSLVIRGGAGTTFLIQLTNGPAGVTVSNNTLDTTGSASMGISVGANGATGLTVDNNSFIAEENDGSVWGPEVVDVTVSNNTFNGPGGLVNGYAVEFAGVTGTSSINDNTITGYGMGIAVFNGEGTSGLSILDNDISVCNNGIRLGQYSATAVNGNMTTVTVKGNTLSTNAIGIRINDGVNVLADQFLIEYNYISGSSTYGLQNEHTSAVVTAMKNWWGSNTGPTHPSNPLGLGDAITDKVIYQPWLDNAGQPDDSEDGYIDAIDDASTEVYIYNAALPYSVTAGRWSHNPDGVYPDFMVVGGYFIDVVVEDNTGFGADTEIEIRFHYDNEDIDVGLIEQTLRMKWWNGSAWLDCSDTGVNTTDNYVWVKVRATDTSPTLAQMNGTPFAASGQRVVIPSLGTWGALLLAGVFLAAIVWVIRRKRPAVHGV